MRKSKQETAQTREAIVAAAADLIRSAGIAEVSQADMMAAAGLTHGGFYRHFRNKEHLVSEALSLAGEKTIATIERSVAKGGRDAAIDSYLSKSHRDAATPICPFAALGSELRRAGNETKDAASDILEKLLTALAGDEPDPAKGRRDAIAVFSMMVGAMTLSRVTANRDLSTEILERAKDYLRTQHQDAFGSAQPNPSSMRP